MKRSVLVALLLVLLLLGGGWLVYGQLFGEEAGGDELVTATERPDAGPAPAPAPPADAGVADGGPDAGFAPVQAKAEVVSVRGFAQAKSGAEGEWRDLAVGEQLDADDAVRTGRGAEAKLAVGEGVEVRLSPRSEFSIREITEGVSRVRLEQGRVSASVDEDGKRVLKVEARGSDAVAETKGGRFGMVTDGKGQVAVATETGKVNLSGGGETVEVEAGQQSTVNKGKAPSAPKAAPKSLFLKVVDPVKRRTNRGRTVVRGRTTPGSLVRAGDKVAVADDRGRFRVPVGLREGRNKIEVEVTDPNGRSRKHRMPSVVVDRKKPTIDAQMQWGGGDDKSDGEGG